MFSFCVGITLLAQTTFCYIKNVFINQLPVFISDFNNGCSFGFQERVFISNRTVTFFPYLKVESTFYQTIFLHLYFSKSSSSTIQPYVRGYVFLPSPTEFRKEEGEKRYEYVDLTTRGTQLYSNSRHEERKVRRRFLFVGIPEMAAILVACERRRNGAALIPPLFTN